MHFYIHNYEYSYVANLYFEYLEQYHLLLLSSQKNTDIEALTNKLTVDEKSRNKYINMFENIGEFKNLYEEYVLSCTSNL